MSGASVEAIQLTQREEEALAAVAHLHDTRGLCPTVREVSAEMGIRASSVSWAHQLVMRLRAFGLVTKEERASRTLRPTPAGRAYLHARRRKAVGS